MDALRAGAAQALLACTDLTIGIPGRTLVERLSFEVAPGELVCMLGENGSGKTLTLHALAGLRAAQAGAVRLKGRPLEAWPRRARARALGLLTQTSEDPFPLGVLEAVLVGRHPHLDFWAWEGAADLAAARAALAACDLAGFESRSLETLSGGERRRVALAALLAQDPEVLLLDEPQNHLDPHHQADVLRLLRARADDGRAVLATLHDPTQAAQYADRVLLLYGDGQWHYGRAAEVLSAESLSRLYRLRIDELRHGTRRIFVAR